MLILSGAQKILLQPYRGMTDSRYRVSTTIVYVTRLKVLPLVLTGGFPS